jgi:hypothetical protein
MVAIGLMPKEAPVNPMWENFERYRKIVRAKIGSDTLKEINDEYANN